MFSAQYVIDEALPLSVAAYDMNLPAGWDLVARIEPSDFGYIARNGTTAAVAFRGTESLDEWAHDADALLCYSSFGPGRLHHGFNQEYWAIRNSVWNALKFDYEKLLIVGHSLGGPLANLCALDLAKWAPQFAARVVVYTFEGPKWGDREAVADYNQKYPVSWRIQNKWDSIPPLPPPPVFGEHEGTTIWIDGGFTPNLHIAHGLLTGCLPGLKKLIS